MKKILILSVLVLSLISLFPGISQAQSSRNETRMRTLQNSFERAETRVRNAEQKIVIGDSLISNGDRLIGEADTEFFRVANKVKAHSKEYRSKRKQLYKLSNSKDREVTLKARSDLKTLDEEHRLTMRAYSTEVREMKKMVMKADLDIKRGQQMQESSMSSLKVSQKSLQDARERYELAMSSFGN